MITPTSLYTRIEMLVSQYNFVIIPTDGKRPHKSLGKTIKKYWSRPPTRKELDEWFSDSTTESYAILCGAISDNLSVFDFDNKREYRRFKKEFSEVARNTFTVRTPRGYHVYLRTQTKIRSQKIQGGDLQSEGTYVIGPGSSVNGRQYRVEIDTPILKITDKQTSNILEEFGKKENINIASTTNKTKQEKQPREILENQYKQLAKSKGRNNALYHVATYARAMQIPQSTTESILVNLHATQKPQGHHKLETQAQRKREATATIRSAYQTEGTAALAYKSKTKRNTGKVPTALREALLKTTAKTNKNGSIIGGSTIPGRLLEALIIEEIEAGNTFSYKTACQIGIKYKIGSKGIHEVLRGQLGETPNGNRLFNTTTPPVGNTDNITNNSKIIPFHQTELPCKVGRNTEFFFLMPSMEDTCLAYDVIPQSWDDLLPDDLMSAKLYRQAIHREFIHRTAPEQSVLYMADRLGCHPRTIYRYDKDLGVQTVPVFGFTPLEWTNVDDPSFYSDVRSDGITPGKWLQRSDGKRFPAIKGIALKQLSKGETLIICERKPSKRILSESITILFDVIWRRSDLPVGEWDVGGSPYSLPELGPETISISLADLPEVEDLSVETSLCEVNVILPNNNTQEKSLVPHPALDGLLTMITGIGNSRRDQLFDLGIFTLSDLVNADSNRLASSYWYGGYVTLKNVLRWQREAAIILGWEKPDPDEVEREKRKQAFKKAKSIYRRKFSSLIKFIDRVFKLIDDISSISDIPEYELTRIFRRLKYITSDSDFFTKHRVSEVYQLASDFFTFFRGYIEHFLSLEDWQLDEYGFGERVFWEKEIRRLEKISIKFQVNEFDQLD